MHGWWLSGGEDIWIEGLRLGLEVNLNLPNLVLLLCSTGRLSVLSRIFTRTSARESHFFHFAQYSPIRLVEHRGLVSGPLWGSLMLASGSKQFLPSVHGFHCGCTSSRASEQSLPHHHFCISSGDCKTQRQRVAIRVFSFPTPHCLC